MAYLHHASQEYVDEKVQTETDSRTLAINTVKSQLQALIQSETSRASGQEAILQQAINNIQTFEVVLADTLPEPSELCAKKIYFVPSANPKATNTKDEYICVKQSGTWKWEQIGSTAITIEYDTEPTDGSSKLVRSGGIYLWAKEEIRKLTSWITDRLANKADKATTLAGYGITDAATKAELAVKADLVEGKVPAAQLPSYVDDVLEYGSKSEFPASGENSKIYVDKDTNIVYRWSGTQYVEISPSPTLDNTVTENSPNGVKSSGIWSAIWGALTALPDGFSSLYDWCTAQIAALQDGKLDKTDRDTYAEEFGEWSYTFVESAGMITGETFYNDELHRWETDYSSDDYAGVTLIASGGVNAQYLDFVYPGVPRVHLVTAIRTKSLVPSGKLLAADNPIPASGAMAKFGTDGKMQVAEPSGTSQAPENADYRDPQDNTCHKTEFGEWEFTGDLRPGSVYSVIIAPPPDSWIYELDEDGEWVSEHTSTSEDESEIRFIMSGGRYITATRSAVCKSDKKYVTEDVVDGKVSTAVSTNNPAFVSAVRNTPTENMPEDMPTDWGTYGTVGAALAALAAFVKWAKAKIVAVIGDDGKPTDQFAADLLGKQVANVKANTVSLAAAYSETTTYAVGEAVTRDGKLYKCAVAITTAEAWTPAHWTETTVATLWNNADTTSYGGQN